MIYRLRDMIYGLRRMIYLLRKHEIISVPLIRVSVYHPRSGYHRASDIIRFRRERISLKKEALQKECFFFHGVDNGIRTHDLQSHNLTR